MLLIFILCCSVVLADNIHRVPRQYRPDLPLKYSRYTPFQTKDTFPKPVFGVGHDTAPIKESGEESSSRNFPTFHKKQHGDERDQHENVKPATAPVFPFPLDREKFAPPFQSRSGGRFPNKGIPPPFHNFGDGGNPSASQHRRKFHRKKSNDREQKSIEEGPSRESYEREQIKSTRKRNGDKGKSSERHSSSEENFRERERKVGGDQSHEQDNGTGSSARLLHGREHGERGTSNRSRAKKLRSSSGSSESRVQSAGGNHAIMQRVTAVYPRRSKGINRPGKFTAVSGSSENERDRPPVPPAKIHASERRPMPMQQHEPRGFVEAGVLGSNTSRMPYHFFGAYGAYFHQPSNELITQPIKASSHQQQNMDRSHPDKSREIYGTDIYWNASIDTLPETYTTSSLSSEASSSQMEAPFLGNANATLTSPPSAPAERGTPTPQGETHTMHTSWTVRNDNNRGDVARDCTDVAELIGTSHNSPLFSKNERVGCIPTDTMGNSTNTRESVSMASPTAATSVINLVTTLEIKEDGQVTIPIDIELPKPPQFPMHRQSIKLRSD